MWDKKNKNVIFIYLSIFLFLCIVDSVDVSCRQCGVLQAVSRCLAILTLFLLSLPPPPAPGCNGRHRRDRVFEREARPQHCLHLLHCLPGLPVLPCLSSLSLLPHLAFTTPQPLPPPPSYFSNCNITFFFKKNALIGPFSGHYFYPLGPKWVGKMPQTFKQRGLFSALCLTSFSKRHLLSFVGESTCIRRHSCHAATHLKLQI